MHILKNKWSELQLGYEYDQAWPIMRDRWRDSALTLKIADMEQFNWADQTLTLTPAASVQLLKPEFGYRDNFVDNLLYQRVFVATLNGQPLYGGVFVPSISAMGLQMPVIYSESFGNRVHWRINPTHPGFKTRLSDYEPQLRQRLDHQALKEYLAVERKLVLESAPARPTPVPTPTTRLLPTTIDLEPKPAPWAEQWRVAQTTARQRDPQAVPIGVEIGNLYGDDDSIRKAPTQVIFLFANPNGKRFKVSLMDTAMQNTLTIAPYSDDSRGANYAKYIESETQLMEQIHYGPGDVRRSRWEQLRGLAQAHGGMQMLSINLDARATTKLTVGVTAVWQVWYFVKDQTKLNYQLVDAQTGKPIAK
jgi:hypothetical protein